MTAFASPRMASPLAVPSDPVSLLLLLLLPGSSVPALGWHHTPAVGTSTTAKRTCSLPVQKLYTLSGRMATRCHSAHYKRCLVTWRLLDWTIAGCCVTLYDRSMCTPIAAKSAGQPRTRNRRPLNIAYRKAVQSVNLPSCELENVLKRRCQYGRRRWKSSSACLTLSRISHFASASLAASRTLHVHRQSGHMGCGTPHTTQHSRSRITVQSRHMHHVQKRWYTLH